MPSRSLNAASPVALVTPVADISTSPELDEWVTSTSPSTAVRISSENSSGSRVPPRASNLTAGWATSRDSGASATPGSVVSQNSGYAGSCSIRRPPSISTANAIPGMAAASRVHARARTVGDSGRASCTRSVTGS